MRVAKATFFYVLEFQKVPFKKEMMSREGTGLNF